MTYLGFWVLLLPLSLTSCFLVAFAFPLRSLRLAWLAAPVQSLGIQEGAAAVSLKCGSVPAKVLTPCAQGHTELQVHVSGDPFGQDPGSIHCFCEFGSNLPFDAPRLKNKGTTCGSADIGFKMERAISGSGSVANRCLLHTWAKKGTGWLDSSLACSGSSMQPSPIASSPLMFGHLVHKPIRARG